MGIRHHSQRLQERFLPTVEAFSRVLFVLSQTRPDVAHFLYAVSARKRIVARLQPLVWDLPAKKVRARGKGY